MSDLKKVDLIEPTEIDQQDAEWVAEAHELIKQGRGDGPSRLLQRARLPVFALDQLSFLAFMSLCLCQNVGVIDLENFLPISVSAFCAYLSIWGTSFFLRRRRSRALDDQYFVSQCTNDPAALFASRQVKQIELFNRRAELWNQSVDEEEYGLGEIPEHLRGVGGQLEDLHRLIMKSGVALAGMRSKDTVSLEVPEKESVASMYAQLAGLERDLVELRTLQDQTAVHRLGEVDEIDRVQAELTEALHGSEHAAEDEVHRTLATPHPQDRRQKT